MVCGSKCNTVLKDNLFVQNGMFKIKIVKKFYCCCYTGHSISLLEFHFAGNASAEINLILNLNSLDWNTYIHRKNWCHFSVLPFLFEKNNVVLFFYWFIFGRVAHLFDCHQFVTFLTCKSRNFVDIIEKRTETVFCKIIKLFKYVYT
jgi:hypothetical protein